MNKSAQRSFSCVLTGVSHRYPNDEHNALTDVNLTIQASQSVALIGPSGAGKSTLLMLLDGRLRGWRGAAVVLNRPLDPRRAPTRQQRADVGFIFQEFALVERTTVQQNVLNGRLGRVGSLTSILGRFNDDDYVAVQQAIRDAGIEQFAHKRVDQLSGGQRQRVAIARCLAQEPRLILADEPVSNLDPAASENVLELLTQTAQKRGATLVFSSHQPDLALRFSDRVIALNEGSVCFDGTPTELTPEQVSQLYGARSTEKSNLRLVG